MWRAGANQQTCRSDRSIDPQDHLLALSSLTHQKGSTEAVATSTLNRQAAQIFENVKKKIYSAEISSWVLIFPKTGKISTKMSCSEFSPCFSIRASLLARYMPRVDGNEGRNGNYAFSDTYGAVKHHPEVSMGSPVTMDQRFVCQKVLAILWRALPSIPPSGV